MFGAARLDQRALRLVQGEIAGITPKRIPDLLDEAEPLPDRQAGNVNGGIYHAEESVVGGAGKQLAESRRPGDVLRCVDCHLML